MRNLIKAICVICLFFMCSTISSASTKCTMHYSSKKINPYQKIIADEIMNTIDMNKQHYHYHFKRNEQKISKKDVDEILSYIKSTKYRYSDEHHFHRAMKYVICKSAKTEEDYTEEGISIHTEYLKLCEEEQITKREYRKILRKIKITKKTSQKTACRRISRYICKNYQYDNSLNTLNPLKKVIKNKSGICHHFASIFQILAKECGIQTVYIEGENKTIGHAWNKVKIGKKWFYIDTTYENSYEKEIRNNMFFEEYYILTKKQKTDYKTINYTQAY